MDVNDLINDDITGYLAAHCQEKISNGEMPTEEEIEAYVYEFKRSPFTESQATFRHLFGVLEGRGSN